MKSKIITVFYCIVALLCLIIGAVSIRQSIFLVDEIKTHPPNSYIYLTDQLNDDAFYNFRVDPQRTDKLLKLNKALKSSTDISFIELRRNKIIFNHTSTPAFFIDSEAFNHFDLITQEGSIFNVEDYNYSLWDTSTVSIILGNDYKNAYNVGDMVPLTLYDAVVTGKVIGFLTKDSTIVYQNDVISTNDHILLPYENITEVATTEEEKEYQFKILLDKNNGVVVSSVPEEDILNLANEFALDISPYYYSKLITVAELLANLNHQLFISRVSYIASLLVCLCVLILLKKRINPVINEANSQKE